jgi:hypothetical protein
LWLAVTITPGVRAQVAHGEGQHGRGQGPGKQVDAQARAGQDARGVAANVREPWRAS